MFRGSIGAAVPAVSAHFLAIKLARRPPQKGAFGEAIGRSLTDANGRPRLLLLSPGNAHDVPMASSLVVPAEDVAIGVVGLVVAADPINRLMAEALGLRSSRLCAVSGAHEGQDGERRRLL